LTNLVRQLLELVRLSKVAGAAIGRVETLQPQMAASLARILAIAFDLAPLALVARRMSVGLGETCLGSFGLWEREGNPRGSGVGVVSIPCNRGVLARRQLSVHARESNTPIIG
jgi:hypothetical protein